ncbi:unnamed protein product [Spirodela intermedia]|uniref:Uncharacterized protein n=1 Tax=Spirodela intermedia TaxID=51605 RepID=A0ABN7ED14_SPIIN|nr:unnamed protein product [Spirodela intermedia]
MSKELDGGGRMSRSFILRSAQQEEALHRIWYAFKRWRLVSQRIVLFSMTTCSMMSHTLHVYSSFLDFSHCSLFFFRNK